MSTGHSETDTIAESDSSDARSSQGGAATSNDGSGSLGTSATDGSSDTSGVNDTNETGRTTGSSTGEPVGECGNGVLEVVGDELEECDDGNIEPDDGCSETCAADRRAFVTSVQKPGGELEGLKLADALCANLADDQGWPDGLTYRAWLSDSTTDARDRFKQGRGRLVMANGLVLAESWSALLAGKLENPLEVTEKSETYQGAVWTGTRPDGAGVPDAEHCEDWATKAVLPKGYFGYSDRTTGEWTLAVDDDQPASCYVDFAVYCFQSL